MASPEKPTPTCPEILPLEHGEPTPLQLERLGAALSEGLLVALPTETVYGLAARADDPAALERLRSAKGRPASLALTWHVGSRAALGAFKQLTPLAERLADAFWPGPLTLVLEGVPKGLEAVAEEGRTGLRLPAHAGTQALLAKLDFPVVMTSANAHGQAAILESAGLIEQFGSQLAMILDAGPAAQSAGSTVLRISPGHFELLRPGPINLPSLQRAAGLRLGFVCTGNTCRSPMAEGLAGAILMDRLGTQNLGEFGFAVESMGVYAGPGSPPSAHGVRVLAERGIDISRHRSQPIPIDRLKGFDRLYCLTQGHMQALLGALPADQVGAVQLLDPRGRDVSDPIGGSLGDYAACAQMIEQAILARIEEWA